MPNPNLTDITFVLDRSGSMQKIRSDTIGGFNAFVSDQKKGEGEANMTLVQFDDQYETLYEARDIQSVEDLNEETYVPRAMTRLSDAVCRTIIRTGERLSAIPENERPENVVFVILTDGLENDSKEFTRAQVKEKIDHQTEAYNWHFTYLGAGHDAVAAGEELGIAAGASMEYTSGNIDQAFVGAGASVNALRSGAAQSLNYSSEQRSRSMGKGSSVSDKYHSKAH